MVVGRLRIVQWSSLCHSRGVRFFSASRGDDFGPWGTKTSPRRVVTKARIQEGQRCVKEREVMDIPGLDKAAAKDFFKKNKIKWNNPESLTAVADFLTEQFQQ